MNAIDRSSTQRNDLAGFVGDIERLEAIFETWDETPRAATEAYRRCDRIAERRSLAAAGPCAEERPGRARRDEIRGRRRSRLRGAATARDRQAQPQRTGREGARKRSPDARLAWRRRRTGQGRRRRRSRCASPAPATAVPASALTFHAGVKKAVQDACPEITEIRQVKGLGGSGEGGVRFISPFALGAEGQLDVRRVSVRHSGRRRARDEVGGEKVLLSRQGAVVACFQNACAHLGLAARRRRDRGRHHHLSASRLPVRPCRAANA